MPFCYKILRRVSGWAGSPELWQNFVRLGTTSPAGPETTWTRFYFKPSSERLLQVAPTPGYQIRGVAETRSGGANPSGRNRPSGAISRHQDCPSERRDESCHPRTFPSHCKQSSGYQLQVSSPGYPTRSDGRILPAETFHPGHFKPLGQYIGTTTRTLPSTAPFQAIRSVHLVTRVATSKAGVSETRIEAPDGTHLNILYPRLQADPGPSHHLPPPTL